MWIPVKIIFLNLFLIVGCTGFSQQFGGGLTAGVVGSQVAGDTFSGYNKGGIFAGGFVTLGMGGRSAMQLELAYFQKGSRENPTEENSGGVILQAFFIVGFEYSCRTSA